MNARSYITQRFPSFADVVHDAKMLIVPSHRSHSITIPGSFREEKSSLSLYKHRILKIRMRLREDMLATVFSPSCYQCKMQSMAMLTRACRQAWIMIALS